ncbi:MAG TPA: hypothetical protein EYQ14_21850 [Gammaproteobacteria bacterium]|nr:hypothetical protein [Gammaproteobacteria bacterium]
MPYADPPFGEKRWLSPTHRSRWEDILPTTRYGAICPQTDGIGFGLPEEGEDCLNLNVWTPDPSGGGLPVMVWSIRPSRASWCATSNDPGWLPRILRSVEFTLLS